MFVDPGIGLWVAQRFNRWLRRRRRPRGVPDPYFRGIRLSYNTTYRVVASLMSLFMLAVACLLYFVPGVFEGQSRWLVIAVKVGWFGITAVCVLAPLQAFREFVVVSDEGLVKYSLFGSRSSLGWKEISGLRSKRGDNEITFEGSGRKLKMSLCYDGWEDFRELARKHLPGGMNLALAGVLDTGKPRPQENPAHPPGVK